MDYAIEREKKNVVHVIFCVVGAEELNKGKQICMIKT